MRKKNYGKIVVECTGEYSNCIGFTNYFKGNTPVLCIHKHGYNCDSEICKVNAMILELKQNGVEVERKCEKKSSS